jgi:hypothetical protein
LEEKWESINQISLNVHRVKDVFDEETNLRVNFISREDLLATKRASGRQQDLADIEAIEIAAKSQQTKP